MTYKVKDLKLASQGENQIRWARRHMQALSQICEQFQRTKPFKNLRIGMALHVTKETGVLVETLQVGGAEVSIASCNPLSTQDDVAAYLAKKGVAVFAYKGETHSDYYRFIKAVVASKPHITIDDGCDLITEIHLNHKNLIPQIIGGCEETTTGINRLKAMERDSALKYPIIAVNDNATKHLFDNYYGTGQSTWDGILRATNILVAGKTVVVCGYGDCSRGIALRGRGLGADVIITETNPVRALQAAMDGYRVMRMAEAAKFGDIFITATGGKHVINPSHIKKMKSGAILANSGHFNVEIDVEGLEKMAIRKKRIRPFVDEFKIDNKTIYLLAEGRLVNLAAAEGHPSEVMDMSFCGQALACEWLVKNRKHLEPKVYTLSREIASTASERGRLHHREISEDGGGDASPYKIDDKIARLKLAALNIAFDSLTKEQKHYAESWQEGT